MRYDFSLSKKKCTPASAILSDDSKSRISNISCKTITTKKRQKEKEKKRDNEKKPKIRVYTGSTPTSASTLGFRDAAEPLRKSGKSPPFNIHIQIGINISLRGGYVVIQNKSLHSATERKRLFPPEEDESIEPEEEISYITSTINIKHGEGVCRSAKEKSPSSRETEFDGDHGDISHCTREIIQAKAKLRIKIEPESTVFPFITHFFGKGSTFEKMTNVCYEERGDVIVTVDVDRRKMFGEGPFFIEPLCPDIPYEEWFSTVRPFISCTVQKPPPFTLSVMKGENKEIVPPADPEVYSLCEVLHQLEWMTCISAIQVEEIRNWLKPHPLLPETAKKCRPLNIQSRYYIFSCGGSKSEKHLMGVDLSIPMIILTEKCGLRGYIETLEGNLIFMNLSHDNLVTILNIRRKVLDRGPAVPHMIVYCPQSAYNEIIKDNPLIQELTVDRYGVVVFFHVAP